MSLQFDSRETPAPPHSIRTARPVFSFSFFWTEGAASSQRAGAEPCDDVIALRREEVAVARARDARAGGPASAAQHLAAVEPRPRVIFVGVRGESRQRHEIRCRPLPHIADHLTASKGTVAGSAGGNIERSVECEVEIGVLAARRCLAPWPTALAVGQAGAIRNGFAKRGGLPFGFGREPAFGPATPGFGLIPIDEHDRRMGRQRLDVLIATPSPVAAVRFKPIDRPFGPRALAPRPPGSAPELTVAISAGTNEIRELGIRHGRLGNAEWRDA